MAAAGEVEPRRGPARLAEADVAEDWGGHGEEGQEGLAGSRRRRRHRQTSLSRWGRPYRPPEAQQCPAPGSGNGKLTPQKRGLWPILSERFLLPPEMRASSPGPAAGLPAAARPAACPEALQQLRASALDMQEPGEGGGGGVVITGLLLLLWGSVDFQSPG